MSLIVARKDGNKLGIVSDTRLTFPYHETKGLKTSPLDGIVKTIILHENLCVSFAGELEHAELAFKEIKDSNEPNFVLQALEKFHKLSSEKTEFLFCISKPQLTIYEIKNGATNETNIAWIGDKKAFDIFQKNMLTPPTKEEPRQTNSPSTSTLKTNQPAITITEMNLTFEVSPSSALLSKISSAMDGVIEDGNIDSVGGFKVNVIYDNKFFYNGYIKNYRSNVTMVGYGAQVIGHGSASDGSYSINFIGGSSDFKSVALHVSQGKFGIVYNRIDNGLLRPSIFNLDEVDFIDYLQDNFNLTASFSTQERVPKFFNIATNYFNQKNYQKAEEFFDKAFNAAKGAERAKVLFNKGLVLLRLKDKAPAMKTFSQTIIIDPSYAQKITNVLQPKR